MEKYSGKKIAATCFYEYYCLDLLASFLVAPDIPPPSSPTTTTTTTTTPLPKTTTTETQRSVILGMGSANADYYLKQEEITELILKHSKVSSNQNDVKKLTKVFGASAIQGRCKSIRVD
jgi:hypothetical protein